MYPIHFSLLLHLVGMGLLFTAIFGGLILHIQYRRTSDWPAKLVLLRSLRRIGLLSPLGVIIMISSGVGNMTLGPNRYTLFSDGWLSMKLMVFAAMVLAGIYFGIQGARRTRIAVRLADGSSSEHDHPALKALDTQQVTAFLTQLVLMIGILWLSIVRPHA